MDSIIRRRIKGRRIGEWNQARAGKPPGYRHTSLAFVPRGHYSSRMMQDRIEEDMLRRIRQERPGPRRDWLVRDYEIWVANGKPTGCAQNAKGAPPKEMEPIKTWQRGKPIHADYSDMRQDDAERRVRKLLKIG